MGNGQADNGYLMPKGFSFYVFGLLFLLYLFDYIDRQVVVALRPYLEDPVNGWGLSSAQYGMLISAVYVSILVCTFPISILVDRWSRKRSIGIMALLWSGATMSCAFTTNFSQLFAARTVIGVGEAGYAPGGTAMISAIFPENKRSLMLGIWNSSIPLGMAMGIVLGGMLAAWLEGPSWLAAWLGMEKIGWHHAFGIVALPGLIIAVLFFFVRDYKTVGLEAAPAAHPEAGLAAEAKAITGKMSKMDIMRNFTGTPSLLLTYAGFAGMMFLSTSMAAFLPKYFSEALSYTNNQANLATSGVLITAIIGSPLGGWAADRWLRKNIKARLLVPTISALLTALFFFASLRYFHGGTLQYIIMVLGGICSIAFASSAIAVTQDVIHPGLRAISYALCVVSQHLLGSIWGSPITGWLTDNYGIATALTMVPSMAVLSALFFYTASKFYQRDLEKVAKVKLELED